MPVLTYWAFMIGTTLARVVPLHVSYGIARIVGIGTYYAWRAGQKRCVRNMRHVTGGDEEAARRHARASFANYLVYLIDFFRLMSTSRTDLGLRVRSDDWEGIEREFHGRGVVAMTMHFGNWDLGAALMAQHDVAVSAIADRFSNRRVNDFVIRSRQHLGLTIIPSDRMGPGLVRSLRQHQVVAVLVDIPAPRTGVAVTFFGDTIMVSDGAARLALRTGAVVVAGMVPRVSPWDDAVRVEASVIPFAPTGDEATDARELTQAVFTHMERHIKRDPAQWYIFRTLWPSDGADDPRPAQPIT